MDPGLRRSRFGIDIDRRRHLTTSSTSLKTWTGEKRVRVQSAYGDMLAMTWSVMEIVNAPQPVTDPGPEDTDDLVTERADLVEARIAEDGSTEVQAIFHEWAVVRFQLFCEARMIRTHRERGWSRQAVFSWWAMNGARNDLREIATELEDRVIDELRA